MWTFLLSRSWRLVLVASIAGALSGVGGAALLATINGGIAQATPTWAVALRFAAVCVAVLCTRMLTDVTLLRLTQDAVAQLRVDLSRQLIATPLHRLQNIGKAELMAILTNDIATFAGTVQNVPAILCNVVLIGSCLAYMAWISWPLVLVFVGVLAAGIVMYRAMERSQAQLTHELRDATDLVYQQFRGLIEGTRELKLNAERRERFLKEDVEGAAQRHRSLFIRTMAGYAWVGNAGSTLYWLVIGSATLVAPIYLGKPSPQALSTFALVALYLIGPIAHLLSLAPSWQQADIALRKIRQLGSGLARADAPASAPLAIAVPQEFHGRIELKGISHQYGGVGGQDGFVLGPLDLHVDSGEVLFLIGGNGSGKTTLGLLLLQLHLPLTGEATLNGVRVDASNLAVYQAHFAAIFADFHLFPKLVGPARDEAALDRNLRRFGLHGKVTVRDGRLSTTDLSSGQRKRLALVSALFEQRPILLFDEWAADQDPEFKRIFYTELLPEMKAQGKTVVIITHDDRYFHLADRIVKLEDGQMSLLPHEQDRFDTGGLDQ